jgi:hypothetical protein
MSLSQKLAFAFLCLTVALGACNGDSKSDKSKMTEKFSDPAFAEVVEGSYMDYECSPNMDDPDFIGIVLNAPKVVTYEPGRTNPINGSFAPLIVCGAYAFKYTTMGLNGDFVDSIVLVAVDEKSRISYHSTMPGVENAEPPPEAIEDDQAEEDFSGDIIGGYFNPNLAVVLGLPEKAADYVVYALLGPYESNRVRISVRQAEE